MGRRRRSLHFVPGGNERMLAKALTLPADGLILDLEDAVPPDRKVATRPVVRDWLSTREFGARERWVRMNPIWGPLGAADLAETIVARPDGRSEEHTSELQSLAYLVCRLLLEKKKKKTQEYAIMRHNLYKLKDKTATRITLEGRQMETQTWVVVVCRLLLSYDDHVS